MSSEINYTEEELSERERPAVLGDTLDESVVSSIRPSEPVTRADIERVASRVSSFISVPDMCKSREASGSPQGEPSLEDPVGAGHVDNPCWDYVPEIQVDPARLPDGLAATVRNAFILPMEDSWVTALRQDYPAPSNSFTIVPKWDEFADRLVAGTGGKPAEVRRRDDVLRKTQDCLRTVAGPLMTVTKMVGTESNSTAISISASWKALGIANEKHSS